MRKRISVLPFNTYAHINARMNALRHIRMSILRVSQADLARIAHSSQSTVSRWECGELHPSLAEMALIRAHALARGISWEDAWFFEPPTQPGEEGAA